MSLPKYPQYKESGVEWLGQVPEGWEVVQGRRAFVQKRIPPFENDEQLSATQKHGVIPQRLFMEKEDQKVVLALSGLDNFKHIEKNEFVISLRSFQGGIERSHYSGCVSPAYTVLSNVKEMAHDYFAFIFKSNPYIEALQTATDGIREGKTISYEQFGAIGLPLPPLPEQTAIATFLDRETARIDTLVGEYRRLIDLLAEKRQGVISHAVTKGIDPSAKMKDSGVEWLGEVPEGWGVKRLKRNFTLLTEKTDRRENPVALENIQSWSSRFIPTETEFEGEGVAFEPGDLLFGKLRPYLAKAYLTDVSGEAVGDFHVMRPMRFMDGRYSIYQILTREFIDIVDGSTYGAKMPRVSWDFMANMPFATPPLAEQAAIAAHLDRETAKLDALTAEAERAIGLLQEHRSALISAAVTGKVDVRGVNL